MFLKELISLKKKKKPIILIRIMGKAWRKSIFIWKLPSKLLQLCSQSEVYNDATQLLFVHLIWCCCVYSLHPFNFYGIFFVCKQHSLTWNISQFNCQPLNTQNGQSIFLHAYGQFLVLCEHWAQLERNQRNKMNLVWGGGRAEEVAFKNFSHADPSFYRWETEAQRGKGAYPRSHS